MAGGKQTPRQRMINILYLVLLGLIALNVPDNLLDAFRKITLSLDASSANVTKDVNDNVSAFEASTLKEQRERATPIYKRAIDARKKAEQLDQYVASLRTLLTKVGGGINPDINDVDGRDNLDISPRLMIEEKRADTLKQKILDTRAGLLADLKDDKERSGIVLSLDAVDPPASGAAGKKTWQEAYFGEGVPLGATLTNLSKIQTDTKNAENEIVKIILSEAQKAQVNLDKFDAVAVAPTSYVLVGQPYTAEVFLTASDSHLSPTISVGGSPIQVEAGKGKYVGSTATEGLHTWEGTVYVKDNDGKITPYPTGPQTYMVARPSAVVSPDKMNVLYIGLPNPVSVSAPGIAKENLRVSMSGGSISGSGEHWTANVSTIGTATINVSGELTKGKISPLGSTLFRVKRIPDPKAQFGGKSGGSTGAANLRAQEKLFAKLDNFEFDAKFNVTRFTLLIARPRQDATTLSTSGAELSQAMRTAMNSVTPGTTVVFKDIIAVGPDGTQRNIDAIVFNAN